MTTTTDPTGPSEYLHYYAYPGGAEGVWLLGRLDVPRHVSDSMTRNDPTWTHDPNVHEMQDSSDGELITPEEAATIAASFGGSL